MSKCTYFSDMLIMHLVTGILLLGLPVLCSSCFAPRSGLFNHMGPACNAGANFHNGNYGKVHYTVHRTGIEFPRAQLCCEGWACGPDHAGSCGYFDWHSIGCTTGDTLTGSPLTWASPTNEPKVRCRATPIGTTYYATQTHR